MTVVNSWVMIASYCASCHTGLSQLYILLCAYNLYFDSYQALYPYVLSNIIYLVSLESTGLYTGTQSYQWQGRAYLVVLSLTYNGKPYLVCYDVIAFLTVNREGRDGPSSRSLLFVVVTCVLVGQRLYTYNQDRPAAR